MCTVTIIGSTAEAKAGPSSSPIIRIVCNRDELRVRPAGLPPETHRFGDRLAIMPIDTLSRGTWIAVNDHGFCATLLNVNPPDRPRRSAGADRSRGTIIPKLMHCSNVRQAMSIARELDPAEYLPFRLALVDPENVGLLSSNENGRLTAEERPWAREPLMFTSSGLGDHLVESPRRKLFGEFFGGADQMSWADLTAAQDRFHKHSWPDRRHLSVCMSRAEARTVSQSIVEINVQTVKLTYFPKAPDAPSHPVALQLARAA